MTDEVAQAQEPSTNPTEAIRGSAEPRPGRCGAKLRRSDPPRYCCRRPSPRRTRCRLHGGKSPQGVASPHYQGKGYSKVLPTNLVEDYAKLESDPDIMSLRQEIGLLRLHVAEVQRAWRDNAYEGGALLKAADAVIQAQRDVLIAREISNPTRLHQAEVKLDSTLLALDTAYQPASRDADLRTETKELALATARVVKYQGENAERAHNMIAIEIAIADRHALINLFRTAIEANVHDLETRRAILRAAADHYAAITPRRNAPALIT